MYSMQDHTAYKNWNLVQAHSQLGKFFPMTLADVVDRYNSHKYKYGPNRFHSSYGVKIRPPRACFWKISKGEYNYRKRDRAKTMMRFMRFWNSQQGMGSNFRWVVLQDQKFCHRCVLCSNRPVTHLTARVQEEDQTRNSHALRMVNYYDSDNNIQDRQREWSYVNYYPYSRVFGYHANRMQFRVNCLTDRIL